MIEEARRRGDAKFRRKTENEKPMTRDRRPDSSVVYFEEDAGVTQLVECLLPKQNVVGSSPITRSPASDFHWSFFLW